MALRHGVDPFFIAAIRCHEDGGAGREFGVLAEPAPTYQQQLAVCCKTIRSYLAAYLASPFTIRPTTFGCRRLCYSDKFIAYAAGRYAPARANNDPTNLNQFWAHGVAQFYVTLLTTSLVAI